MGKNMTKPITVTARAKYQMVFCHLTCRPNLLKNIRKDALTAQIVHVNAKEQAKDACFKKRSLESAPAGRFSKP